MNAKVFIGSAAESKKLAVALQSLLDPAASVRVWDQRLFQHNNSNLENILRIVDEYDFACFLAPPLDKVESQGRERAAIRDNIILEHGLFLGRFGSNRVFLIHPRGADMGLPTDLEGISNPTYKPVDDDNPAESVLAPVGKLIEEHIERYGPRRKPEDRRYSPVLERGGVDLVGSVADAALYFSRKRHGYRKDIENLILQREVIPSLYYYATQEGAEFWLAMSSEPRYRFKSNSHRLMGRVAGKIAEALMEGIAVDRALDFISLGSGDGEKDRVLLKGLVDAGASLTYYPLDISDTLLVECVRNVQTQALDQAQVKTKAIIGDFIDLRLLKSVYEDRPSPNVFSLLGNTFGNTDEGRIMKALSDSMYPGDYVLIEINSDVNELGGPRSFLREELALRYSCIPISMLSGENADLKKAEVREEEDLSVFPCAHSSATYYASLELEGKVVEDIPLEHNHRYPVKEFQDELSSELGVDILVAESYGNAAIVLGRRQG